MRVASETEPMGAQIDIRPVTEATYDAFRHAFAATFGFASSTDEIERSRAWAEYDRLLMAWAPDGSIVGTSGALSFGLSLPGARSAACAGITMVSVRADHRRRGLLTRMMVDLLDDAAARSEPFAALWASESPIYGRYGFGPAVPTIDISLDRRHADLHLDGPVGEVRFVDVEEARATFPALHERLRATRGGVMSRSDGWWTRVVPEEPGPAKATGPLRLALLPDRGYVIYHLASGWSDGAPRGVVHVHDLLGLDPAALAALWRFAIDTDLSETLEIVRRPPDDPVLHLLRDPARARAGAGWPLYLRLVDVPSALAARGYLGDGTVVVDVADRLRPANAGRWRLTASDGNGRCERTDDAPDVSLDVAELAAISLGGVRATALLDAGRLSGSSGAAVLLDRLFATERAPVSDQMF